MSLQSDTAEKIITNIQPNHEFSNLKICCFIVAIAAPALHLLSSSLGHQANLKLGPTHCKSEK